MYKYNGEGKKLEKSTSICIKVHIYKGTITHHGVMTCRIKQETLSTRVIF